MMSGTFAWETVS